MAASRADGYYYPPEWKPEGGSLNRWNNSHGALGKRANKLHLGILVVRFELPYNSWCEGCGCHIAQGVRYNAEKKQAGEYLSTPVYEFRMTCRRCNHPFVIQTNPKETRYDYISGIRRKKEAFLDEADGTVRLETHVPRDGSGRRMDDSSALERLERSALSEARAKVVREPVEELLELADERRGMEKSLRRTAMRMKRGRAEEPAAEEAPRPKRVGPVGRVAVAASDRESAKASTVVGHFRRRGAGPQAAAARAPAAKDSTLSELGYESSDSD